MAPTISVDITGAMTVRKQGKPGGPSDVEGFPAAATPFFIGVTEYETFFHLVDLVIHLGAKHEHDGFWVNQKLHAILQLDDFFEARCIICIFKRVGQTRAPFAAHAKADAFAVLPAGGSWEPNQIISYRPLRNA